MNKFLIFLILFLSYSLYKLYDFLDLNQKAQELGMNQCSQLNLWNACIQSQTKYKNYIIISACKKCDCIDQSSIFYSFEMSTREVNIIEINIKEDEMQKIFKIKAMNVFENYLFGINDANNTVIVYEISINSQQLLQLNYFYSIPVQLHYQLDSILALSPYEMIATVQNKSSIYNGTNQYIEKFYDFLSYFGVYKQSFVLYLRNDIYDNYFDIKPVIGTEASKLSGMAFDHQYRLFIGRPLEKAIGVYKYRGYKNWGVELKLTNITYVRFPVNELSYSKTSDELVLCGTVKLYNEDPHHGQVSRLKLSMDNNEFQLIDTIQTNRKISGMSSAIFENSNYYLGSKSSEQFIKCEKEK